MLYLKNALGGLGRSLTDSAVQTLHEPRRWWKFALYAAVFVLPGGTLGVLALAWIDRRRAQRNAQAAQQPLLLAAPFVAPPATAGVVVTGAASVSVATAGTSACQTRAERPVCRAAAGTQVHPARKTKAEGRSQAR